jgi:hypothetical protein
MKDLKIIQNSCIQTPRFLVGIYDYRDQIGGFDISKTNTDTDSVNLLRLNGNHIYHLL